MVMQPDRRRWYEIKNAAKEDSGPPEILIYDEIDSYYGIAAGDFVRELAQIDAPAITVRINSIGGDVFDGIAILNALRGHDATINVIVDGIAASIASVIAMGGDTITMNRNSQMMLHNGWAVCIGDMKDMAKTAEMLAKTTTNLAAIYAERAGGTVDDWLATMDEETWLTAEEAVDAGLADSIVEPEPAAAAAAASVAASFDRSRFRYSGRQAAPAPRIAARAKAPQPAQAEVTNGKEPTVASLNESLAQKLGLGAEADDDAILAAVEALGGLAADDDIDTDADADADTSDEPDVSTVQQDLSPDQVTAVAARLGLTVVDKSVHDRLVADVQQLNSMRAKQLSDIDDQTIRNALDTGKITPASAEKWREELGKNREGISNLLASMPENRALAIAGVGHGVAAEDTLDAEMVSVFNRVTGTTLGKDA
jgi:ATP-dependent protease ClpP protease subunit